MYLSTLNSVWSGPPRTAVPKELKERMPTDPLLRVARSWVIELKTVVVSAGSAPE
jgi:hypothetical protein